MRTGLFAMMVALAWCGLTATTVRAQPAYEANFDTTFPTFGYGYDYSGVGAPADSVDPPPYTAIDTSSQTTSTYNVTAPPAATATFDSTQWVVPTGSTYTYCGWGLGMGFGFPEDNRPLSGDLSQYTVSFDVKVEGYAEFDDGIRTDVLIIFQGPGFANEEYAVGVNGGNNGGNLGNFTEVPLITSTTQTFSHPLSDFAIINNAEWDFTTLFAQTTQVLVQLQPSSNADEIGLDNNNILTVDNVKFDGPFGGGGVLGDFDDDDDVDGDDLLVWQSGESTNGLVAGDLTDWRNNYGTQPMAAGAAAAIPEPGCLALAGVAAVGLLTASRRRVRCNS